MDMSAEWTEVDLVLPSKEDRIRLLLDVVDPFMRGMIGQYINCWFYGDYNEPPVPAHLRIRILWHAQAEAVAKTNLFDFLDGEKGAGTIADWYEGAHGVRNQTYLGEADQYGTEMWEATYKVWASQSEYAITLLRNESASSLSKETFAWHWERNVHLLTGRLFLNTLDEIYLSLRQGGGYLKLLEQRNNDVDIKNFFRTLAQNANQIQIDIVNNFRPSLAETVINDFNARSNPSSP
jgi:hypothetical protein